MRYLLIILSLLFSWDASNKFLYKEQIWPDKQDSYKPIKIEFIIVKDDSKAWIKLIDKIDQNLNGNQSLASLIDIDDAMGLVPSIYRNGKIPFLYIENSKKEDINLIINNSKNNKTLNYAQFLWGIKNKDIEGHTALYLLNRYVEFNNDDIKFLKAEAYSIDHIQAGEWYLYLEFKNAKGFERITSNNRGKLLAIILDNEVVTAPRMNDRITTGNARISKPFTSKEAKDIENRFKAHKLNK